MLRLMLLASALLGLAACGGTQARVGGDPDGAPVSVALRYDAEALPLLTGGNRFSKVIVVERDPFYGPGWYGPHHYHSHHWHHPYHWYDRGFAYEPDTRLSLLIGRAPAEAQYLRADLRAGVAAWTLAIRPGTEAVVSLQARGGRTGWNEIGRFTAAPGRSVTVILEGAEPRLEVSDPPADGPARLAPEPAGG